MFTDLLKKPAKNLHPTPIFICITLISSIKLVWVFLRIIHKRLVFERKAFVAVAVIKTALLMLYTGF